MQASLVLFQSITLFSFEGAKMHTTSKALDLNRAGWGFARIGSAAMRRRSGVFARSGNGTQAPLERAWPVGQVVKTAASHAANRSSTLLRVTRVPHTAGRAGAPRFDL